MKNINFKLLLKAVSDVLLFYILSMSSIFNNIFCKGYKYPAIENLEYVKSIKSEGGQPYRLAIYRKKDKTLLFAKIRQGYLPDFHTFSLQNEAKLLEVLNSVRERVNSKIPSRYSYIQFPKCIDIIKKGNFQILLTEYVEEKVSIISKKKVILDMPEMLKFLSREMKSDEIKRIRSVSGEYILALYVLDSIRAFVTRPHLLGAIVKNFNVFSGGFSELFAITADQIAHRDLHYKNIVLVGKKAYVVDFAFSVFTNTLYDYIVELVYFWDNPPVRLDIKKKINTLIKNNSQLGTLYAPLCVFVSTGYLAGPVLEKADLKNYKKFFTSIHQNTSLL